MISVQNHRPLLNGSKLLLVALALFFIASCGNRRITNDSNNNNTDVIIIDDTNNNNTNTDNTNTTDNNTNTGNTGNTNNNTDVTIEPIDTIVTIPDDIDVILSSYDIALLLPFTEDSVRNFANNNHNYKEVTFPEDALNSIEFYEGFIAALDSFHLNSRINLHVFDTKANTYVTEQVLRDIKNKGIQVVIGPYHVSPSKKVAQFCKQNDIVHVLPFTPSYSVTSNNPKHIKCNPSIYAHIEKIADYIAATYPQGNVKIIHQTDNLENKLSAALVSRLQAINAANATIQVRYADFTIAGKGKDRKWFEVKDYIDFDTENIVVVPTFDESLIHNVMRQLNAEKKRSDITLFGMPTWSENDNLRLEYFNNLKLHLTNADKLDEDKGRVISFSQMYDLKYGREPSKNAFLGFDTGYFLTYLISNHGLSMFKHIENYHFDGMMRDFEFHPNLITTPNGESAINFYENKNLHVYYYEDFEKILVDE